MILLDTIIPSAQVASADMNEAEILWDMAVIHGWRGGRDASDLEFSLFIHEALVALGHVGPEMPFSWVQRMIAEVVASRIRMRDIVIKKSSLPVIFVRADGEPEDETLVKKRRQWENFAGKVTYLSLNTKHNDMLNPGSSKILANNLEEYLS